MGHTQEGSWFRKTDTVAIWHPEFDTQKWATPGTYYVEVTRADPNDTTPVRGEVRVRAFDERQTIPFELSGDRSTVGRVQVVRRWRLEPAPGGRPRGPLEGLQGL